MLRQLPSLAPRCRSRGFDKGHPESLHARSEDKGRTLGLFFICFGYYDDRVGDKNGIVSFTLAV